MDYEITITFDGKTFTYTDEGGADGRQKKVFKRDTIRWKLNDISTVGDPVVKFRIVFNKDGDPFHKSEFDAPVGTDTHKGHLDYPSRTTYDYTVFAVLKSGKQISDDPQIIFQDYPLNLDLQLFDDSLAKLGTKAQAAFQGLLTDLKATAGLKRDPNGEFFPGGINNITVQVTALNVTVNITVSGPEATALFPSPAREK